MKTSTPTISSCLLTGIGLAATLNASQFFWDPVSGGNGHYYEPVPYSAGLSWNEAKLEAESRGGYLATITSDAENQFVFSLINSPEYWAFRYDYNTSSGPLIGGFQLNKHNEPSGNFGWVTGESFSFVSFAVGQPDNLSNDEEYVGYFTFSAGTPSATWNDFNQWYTSSYIIEYNQVPESSNVAAAIACTGLLGYTVYRRHAART
jgi:hypothetical protein